MTSPSLELQAQIVAILKADATVTSLCAGRIYDAVPASAQFPYVNMSAVDELSDDADCITSYDISYGIDCWSQEVGQPEVKRLSDAVRAAFRKVAISLTDNALVDFRHRQTRIFLDADGISHHAAMDFQALVEQPS